MNTLINYLKEYPTSLFLEPQFDQFIIFIKYDGTVVYNENYLKIYYKELLRKECVFEFNAISENELEDYADTCLIILKNSLNKN